MGIGAFRDSHHSEIGQQMAGAAAYPAAMPTMPNEDPTRMQLTLITALSSEKRKRSPVRPRET
ncbi:hypothetical protein CMMCAS04_04240 [Clavibacter michiganensis subsp. michiganensis]|nr:hypothetical protein CMMCAS04_04240 [Clavibacter michiganensis subsp. michiganensis]